MAFSSSKLAVSKHYSVAFGDDLIAESNIIGPAELKVPQSGSSKLSVSKYYSVAYGDELIAESNII